MHAHTAGKLKSVDQYRTDYVWAPTAHVPNLGHGHNAPPIVLLYLVPVEYDYSSMTRQLFLSSCGVLPPMTLTLGVIRCCVFVEAVQAEGLPGGRLPQHISQQAVGDVRPLAALQRQHVQV